MSETETARYTGLMNHLKAHLVSEEFKEKYRQSVKNFIRQRSLPFTFVVLFLLNLVKRSLQDELDEFFSSSTRHPNRDAGGQQKCVDASASKVKVRSFYRVE